MADVGLQDQYYYRWAYEARVGIHDGLKKTGIPPCFHAVFGSHYRSRFPRNSTWRGECPGHHRGWVTEPQSYCLFSVREKDLLYLLVT